jgi:pyridoxamine 5'-phosphate oxidase
MSRIQDLRIDYKKGELSENTIGTDPIIFFKKWFEEALNSNVLEPNAMVLSTVDVDNKPQSRVVLLKDISEGGFTFFTNYSSNKGQEIANNANVSLLFFWAELERQVRIGGIAKKISREDSEQYFHSRPRGSQIGAHVSPQSKVIASRDVLEQLQLELERKFEGIEIPLPSNWGGYRVEPNVIEFWQGRSNRLHDRIRFSLRNGQEWNIERLAP